MTRPDSSNNHIIASDNKVLKEIKSIKRFDVVELDGYLVDVSRKDGWHWQTSLTREDTNGGSCEVFWVNSINEVDQP